MADTLKRLGQLVLLLMPALVVSLALAPLSSAQNVNGLYSGVAQTLTYIQGQYVYTPIPQATITVCNYPATLPAAALPCTNLATLYADPTTSTPAPSQFAADAQGNFSFWAGVGYYAYTITNPLTNVVTGPYSVVASPGSGGGGGGGGAVFPFPGLVYATTNSAGTVATSAQVVATLNNTPTTTFAPALLPLATTSTFGAVRPDGISVTIANGVISSVPPTVTIPATSFLLKGTGVANVATAASPGTDYVTPSQLSTYAPLASPALTGIPTVPTASPGTNTTQAASTAFVLANAGGGFVNPMTQQADMIQAAAGGTPTRLPANSNSGQAMLISTAAASTVVPTTKTCANQSGSSVNTTTCTWSTPLAVGETAFCYVWNSAISTTFTLIDSGSNSYTNYGAVHSGTTTSEYSQTFYALASTGASTTTVTASVGNFLGIQCDSASNIKPSAPTDGQAVVDSVGSPITSPTITTTAAGDYIFCGTIAGFGVTLGPGTGFTGGASFASNGLNQYTLQGTAGAITPTMFSSTGGAASMTCSAFKSGTGVTPASNAWQQSATLRTLTLSNVIAPNTSVLPIPSSPSGGDDYAALQNAINTAIANGQCKEVYIPPGSWHSSQGLVANAECVKLRGDPRATYITFTGTGFNGITVGDGLGDQAAPTGYTFGLALIGPGSSNAGFAGLQINGLTQYEVDSVTVYGWDMGFDLINNNYGTQFSNIRACFNAPCNVGLNLRTGSQSGSDLAFFNNWIAGATCGVSISPGGGGYHFYGGQIGTAQTTSYNDNSGSVCLGKDYLTGSTSGGAVEADFYGTSFEDTNYGWVFRGFEQASIETHYVSANPSNCSAPGIGFYKNTNFEVGKAAFYDTALSGCFNNTGAGGSPLIQISGIQGDQSAAYQGANIIEEGTYTSGTVPTIGGSSLYVQSMFAQSGLQNLATVISMAGISIPGNAYTTPLTLINNNAGALETSNSTGCFTGGTCVTQTIPSNPLTTLGDLPYGGVGGSFTRLAGNGASTDAVLVSHGTTATNTPTSKTCTNSGGGGVNSVACTWSSAPVAGETAVCELVNGAQFTTFSVTDSASDTWNMVGSPHNASTIFDTTQTAYFTLGTSITTTTVNSSAGNFLTINCNTFTQPSVSTDGQCSVDTSSGANPSCSSAITTTANGDYVMCGAHNTTSGDNFTAGSGFTAGASFNANNFSQYLVQSSAGAITPQVSSSGTGAATMTCTAFKANQSAQAPTLKNNPALSNDSMFAGGSTFTATGCGTPTSLTGGALAGSFLAQSGTCTAVITTRVTAPHGYGCSVWDITTPADIFKETAFNATTVTFSGTPSVSDQIVFQCTPF